MYFYFLIIFWMDYLFQEAVENDHHSCSERSFRLIRYPQESCRESRTHPMLESHALPHPSGPREKSFSALNSIPWRNNGKLFHFLSQEIMSVHKYWKEKDAEECHDFFHRILIFLTRSYVLHAHNALGSLIMGWRPNRMRTTPLSFPRYHDSSQTLKGKENSRKTWLPMSWRGMIFFLF